MTNRYLVATFAFVVLGSVWLGLSSCVGHAWHRDAFKGLLAMLLVIGVIGRELPGERVWHRLGWCALLLFTNHVVEVVASAFFPDLPHGWSDLARRVALTVQHGAC